MLVGCFMISSQEAKGVLSCSELLVEYARKKKRYTKDLNNFGLCGVAGSLLSEL